MEEEIRERQMRPKKKKIKRHREAAGWLREPSQAGEKRLLEQRDAQQRLQEPQEQGSPDWQTGTKWRGE